MLIKQLNWYHEALHRIVIARAAVKLFDRRDQPFVLHLSLIEHHVLRDVFVEQHLKGVAELS